MNVEAKKIPHKISAVLLFVLFILMTKYVSAEIPEKQFTSDIIKYSGEIDPNKRIKLLESMLENASAYQRFIILPKLAKTAVEVNSFSNALDFACELLYIADDYKGDWNYGNAIHDANIVKGMVSLNNNLLDEAKRYLLKAGKAPTSPQLKSFGPNMMLAKALLERGEADVVVKYLISMKKIWKYDEGSLDSWIAIVTGGGKPDFGDNLFY